MKSEIKDTVTAWVNRNLPGMEHDLARICRIPSVAEIPEDHKPPFGKACADGIRLMLQIGCAYGFETDNYDDSVGCIHYGNGKGKHVGIWSHLDVVAPGPASAWKLTDPFTPFIRQGYFIARGAQDNKSSAIMALYLLRFLKEHGIHPDFAIDCYFGSCEEQGMYDIDDYLAKGYPVPDVSLVPDSGFPACCGERGSFDGILTFREPLGPEVLSVKSGNEIYMTPDTAQIEILLPEGENPLPDSLPQDTEAEVRTDPGTGRKILRLTCHGVSGHAADPAEGINALTLLAERIVEYRLVPERDLTKFRFIAAYNRDPHGRALGIFAEDAISGPTVSTFTGAVLDGRKLCLSFFSKYPVTAGDLPIPENAKQAAEQTGCDLEILRYGKPAYFPPDHPVMKIFAEEADEITGCGAEPFIMSGGTYAHKLPHAFACGTGMPLPPPPEGLFLPGHGDYHEPDEAVPIERMRKALIVYILGFLRMQEEGMENLSG